MRLFCSCLIWIIASAISTSIHAAYVWMPSPPPEEIEAKLARVSADPAALKAAIAAGKRAAFFCVNCHGEVGVSALDHVPNLAGQNAFFLLTQIDKFGDGRRKDDFMSGLVKVLKPVERFNIAVFYSSQPVPPTPAKDPGLALAGGRHFRRACAGCHGVNAHGTREIARLAGQRGDYLISTLRNYRSGSGLRADARMTGVARTLSDAEIDAIASFLGTLP